MTHHDHTRFDIAGRSQFERELHALGIGVTLGIGGAFWAVVWHWHAAIVGAVLAVFS